MRYFKHLALWTICGLLVVALAGALAGAMTGGVAAGVMWSGMSGSRLSDMFSGAFIGAIVGSYSGAICGFVALLVLAIPRPPMQKQGAVRLSRALKFVSGFVLVGTPVLAVGFSVLALTMIRISHNLRSSDVNRVIGWVFDGHFLFVALPALVGAIVAGRVLKRTEEEAARALPTPMT